MKKHKIDYNKLLNTSDQHLKKLHDIVLKSIEEEQLISKKLESKEELTIGQRLADKVADFGGSWNFIIIFVLLILVWMGINVYFLKEKGFDPYPFILLNLLLSCLAAFQAPIIMMSQNRQEEKDRSRAEEDYLVNLKAEIEIKTLHEKIDLLITEQMETLLEIQKMQIERIDQLEQQIKNFQQNNDRSGI
ncbi:protein of unknown function DUF1003 [Pseudopedobacter saltans DSM 12145]|uniref:Cyclic nucleotide-binding protein n=1 Tax=Pseudopedobacter saltans (strain ATCC 51119 / DSM 12145 / JCM 21818 / CCUG 39354 / LMG 10337 / NBRC 100064 / NCIMB 13643) TaxID=762903 RepID=F0S9J4_PSESL|nr:DUF1003 domain-containing protein [Pseudopedobacter saltans]ADY53547.1 protein of unknown function DUF1003 [Pseudopedobacter saltans DSM 12145]